MADDTKRLIIGRVSGVHGIKGWIKLLSYTRPRENIFHYSPWRLQGDQTETILQVCETREQGKGLSARLEGITDRNQALTLVGCDIAIERAQLKPAAPNEYYWHDLLGAEVFNQHAELLGQVTGVLETGSNDVLVVEGETRHLIPFVEPEYIREVDLEQHIIRVVWDE